MVRWNAFYVFNWCTAWPKRPFYNIYSTLFLVDVTGGPAQPLLVSRDRNQLCFLFCNWDFVLSFSGGHVPSFCMGVCVCVLWDLYGP